MMMMLSMMDLRKMFEDLDFEIILFAYDVSCWSYLESRVGKLKKQLKERERNIKGIVLVF